MKLTALMDDYCPQKGLHGEHGLSLLLEHEGFKILFDTGYSGAALENATALGIPLDDVAAIVLSHGHYDHGGGLPAAFQAFARKPVPLFAGRDFDVPKWSRAEEGIKKTGIPAPSGYAPEVPLQIVDAPMEISPRIHLLPAAAFTDAARPPEKFRKGAGSNDEHDEFKDEVSIVVELDTGIVVITGCAHRGILNILADAAAKFPGKALLAVVGGFHIMEAKQETLKRVAEGIASYDPKAVYAMHCTGPRGYAALAPSLGDRLDWLSCGKTITF